MSGPHFRDYHPLLGQQADQIFARAPSAGLLQSDVMALMSARQLLLAPRYALVIQRRHDGTSRLAPLEDRLAMLLKSVQARLQSMKHRDGAIGLLPGLS